MRIITYDLEVAKDPMKLPGSWGDARKGHAGFSSLVLYDTTSGRYHIYGPEIDYDTTLGKGRTDKGGYFQRGHGQLSAAIDHLNEADILLGFNNIDFDQPAIEGHSQLKIRPPQMDILAEVWKALGYRKTGYGLGPICERTLGLAKSGSGEHAPDLFQAGRFYELVDYNLNDVHLTRMLFNHILDEGFIIKPDGEKLEIKLSEDLTYA